MKQLNIKNLTAVMDNLYEIDKESYDELWKAIRVLSNLGLVEDKLTLAMVKEDRKLWEESARMEG